jgi:phosphoglycerol transferase MdoB-like AlkP superfamily enzyme
MSNQNQSRRRSKVRGFIIAETVAIGVLLLTGAFVLAAGPVNPPVRTVLNVVLFAAAAGVAAIPILFFALAPILPRSGR